MLTTHTSITTTTKLTNFYLGTEGTAQINWGYNLCNAYLASTTNIDATAISEIWYAGINPPAPSTNLKYWDGTAWIDPSNSYIWDGVNWQDSMGYPAAYWNGSAWTDVIHTYV